MGDLAKLYQEVILEHSKNPQNFGMISPCSHQGHGHNPLCGDRVTVFVNLDKEGVISEIGFDGKGCAISIASASLMTEILKGSPKDRAIEIFDKFLTMTASEKDDVEIDETSKRLTILSGVRQFPMRVKCATLPWNALNTALFGTPEVSTETLNNVHN